MKKKRTVAIIISAVISLITIAIVALALLTLQTTVQLKQVESESIDELSRVDERVEEINVKVSDNIASYDDIFISRAKTLAYMIGNEIDEAPDGKTIEAYRKLLKVDMCAVIDRSGKTILRAGNTGADFTARRFTELRSISSIAPDAEPFSVDFGNIAQRFYSHMIDDDRIAVVGIDTADFNDLKSAMSGWDYKLKSMSISYGGFGFAVSDKDYKILYHPDETLIGQNALNLGIKVEDLKDGSFELMMFNGDIIYGNVKHFDDAYVICAVKNDSIKDAITLSTFIILSITVLLVVIVALFRKFMINKKLENKVIKRKSTVAVGLCLLFLTCCSFYVQTLFAITRQSMSFDTYSESINSAISDTETDIDTVTERYNDSYLSKAEVAAYIVKTKPDVMNHDSLVEMSDALGIKNVYIFDKDGKTSATSSGYTNFVISDDPKEQSYVFRQLLNGVDYVIQEAMPNEVAGEYCQYVGVCLRDDEGLVAGAVQIEVIPELLQKTVDSYKTDVILSNIRVANGGSTVAITKEDGTYSYHEDSSMIGKEAAEFEGVKDKLKDQFRDFITINNKSYYAVCIDTPDNYIISLVPKAVLYKDRTLSVMIDLGVAILTFIMLLLIFGRLDKKLSKLKDVKNDGEGDFKVKLGSRYIQSEPSAKRTSVLNVDWDSMSADQQIGQVITYVLTVFALGAGIILLFKNSLFENSILGYITEGSWSKGVNIFAITASLIFVLIVSVAQSLIRDVLKIIAKDTDARGETVCRLLMSVVKYIAIIIEIYYVLSTLGVDTSALIASMGILTMVIGLGANKVIGDVLAGLFIIMEGEFRVGDIVHVDDFEGVVQDIGIRTTKIVNDDQNVKIINNSDINGVINMTREYSVAWTFFTIEYHESLERVENVLADELPKVKERNPSIVEGPFYKGVYQFSENGVVIVIMTFCKEQDRPILQFVLNREMKLICDRNKINIPVSQIVVSEPADYSEATEWQKKRAEIFAQAQFEQIQSIKQDIMDDGKRNQSNVQKSEDESTFD